MGKSSSGKDTVFQKIVNDNEINIKGMTIYTTRPKRVGERGNYHFITAGELNKFEEEGVVIEKREYTTVEGLWQYATIDEGLDLKDRDYIVITTPDAVKKYIKYFGDERIVVLYLDIDDKTRLLRSIERESQQNIPNYRELARRFLADSEDFENISGIRDLKIFHGESSAECFKKIKEFLLRRF
jgi:guanylate kinase